MMDWTRSSACMAAFVAIALGTVPAAAKTLTFAGHTWLVRPNGDGPPRNNTWCQKNAFVDAQGALHLKLTDVHGTWCATELTSTDRMGFGTYQWKIKGAVDQLDPNVVFGLFHYPTPEVGPDGTDEIDIEFSKWGNPQANGLNYTVYPAHPGPETHIPLPIALTGETSTHRYTWAPGSVHFQSVQGDDDGNAHPIADWTFAPPVAGKVASVPMPVHINLWKIAPPTDGKSIEVVITDFRFTPAP